MQKDELAQELLQHFHRHDVDPKELVGKSADEVIRAYMSCECCGELLIPETALEPYIHFASDWMHFIDLCQETIEELSEAMDQRVARTDDTPRTMH